MIPKEKWDSLCYCRCCCLSDAPEDSAEHDVYGRMYSRRYDCSCKRYWPNPYVVEPNNGLSFEVIAMRARDVGRDYLADDAVWLKALTGAAVDEADGTRSPGDFEVAMDAWLQGRRRLV